jgi:hypothetical protein
VIRLRALLPAVLCVPLLAACWNGRILFTFEQPFWSSIGGESRVGAALAVASAERGYFPRIDVEPVSPDPVSALAGKIAPRGYAAVIVGPLLSFEWEGFATKFPRTKFVLIDAPVPSRDAPANAVFLTFDRTGAFRDAGRAAGTKVQTKFGAVDASRLGPRIAVLTSVDSDISAAEVDAFTRGVADSLDGGRPEARFLTAPVDTSAVNAAVSQMRRAGAEIFLLGLGEHNPSGLQALRDAGGSAVLGDWLVSGAFPAQVLFSVEEDVPGGIALALDGLRTGVMRVSGPVKLVSGKKI